MPPDYKQKKEPWSERRKKPNGLFRDGIIEKVVLLKERIEDCCNENGYDNMGNQVERKNDKGEIFYRRTDWEYVDDTYGNMINDVEYYPHTNDFKIMNKLWKQYV